jgi:hypothetical protein
MKICQTCGKINPETMFTCLACSELMPATPAPVQNIDLVQQRRIPNTPIPASLPTATGTFKQYGIYIGIAIGVVGLFCAMFFVLNKIQPLPATNSTTTVESASSETGYYRDYKFTLMKKPSENQIVALFQPKMLPANNEIFIGATRQIISQAFGKEVSGVPTRDGKEIKFSNNTDSFYVLPVKEDSGEINSLVIRQ